MRLLNVIALNTIAVLGLASCGMEDEKASSQEMGALEVGVAVKQPASESSSRASVNTSDYPVSIVGKEGSSAEGITKEYDKVSDLPTEIPLAVGSYTVSSHTPGEMTKKMTTPYYAGSANFVVVSGVTTQATVTCRMQNSRIQMNYSAEFLTTFTKWTITIDDGSETVLSYDNTDTNPAAIYWSFGDKVSSVTVNFRGTTAKGTVSDSRTYTKSQAAEKYDDDSEYFNGGEALIFNMKPAISTTGDVTGIDMKLNIVFEDHTDEVEIPVNWDKPIVISEPNGTSYLTDGISLSENTTTPSNADVLVKATAGIQNLYLKVASDNASFTTTANGLGLVDGDGLDLTSTNASTALGSYLTLPTAGVTEYTLKLTGLLNWMKTYTGTHTLTFKVVDANGNKSNAVVTVKVTDGGTVADGPTLTLPADVTFGASTKETDLPSADALLGASAGMKSVVVKIKAGNDGFAAALNDVKLDGQSLITGADLVDNADFTSLLVSVLGEGNSAPHKGDTQYTFKISVFFSMMQAFGATDAGAAHEFNIVITDQNGQTKEGTFKVTITE